MRIYQSTLLEDFAARAGKVRVGTLQASDVVRTSEQHDLMVVASGRGSLTEMFPRDPARSPYSHPQRLLTGAFYRGLAFPDPLGVIYTVSPGNGEIFQAPFTTFEGRVCSILIEGIPGQAFETIMSLRYENAAKHFEATVLDLLRQHARAHLRERQPEGVWRDETAGCAPRCDYADSPAWLHAIG
jgi:Styrene monooxygenase A putative substrate binding domain